MGTQNDNFVLQNWSVSIPQDELCIYIKYLQTETIHFYFSLCLPPPYKNVHNILKNCTQFTYIFSDFYLCSPGLNNFIY